MATDGSRWSRDEPRRHSPRTSELSAARRRFSKKAVLFLAVMASQSAWPTPGGRDVTRPSPYLKMRVPVSSTGYCPRGPGKCLRCPGRHAQVGQSLQDPRRRERHCGPVRPTSRLARGPRVLWTVPVPDDPRQGPGADQARGAAYHGAAPPAAPPSNRASSPVPYTHRTPPTI